MFCLPNGVPVFEASSTLLFTLTRVNQGASEGSEGGTFHAVVCRFVVALITVIMIHLALGLLSCGTLNIMDDCANPDSRLSTDLSITPCVPQSPLIYPHLSSSFVGVRSALVERWRFCSFTSHAAANRLRRGGCANSA